jgi:hypothetical protein
MCYCYKTTDMEQKLSKKTRTESDLIGSREVPESALEYRHSVVLKTFASASFI